MSRTIITRSSQHFRLCSDMVITAELFCDPHRALTTIYTLLLTITLHFASSRHYRSPIYRNKHRYLLLLLMLLSSSLSLGQSSNVDSEYAQRWGTYINTDQIAIIICDCRGLHDEGKYDIIIANTMYVIINYPEYINIDKYDVMDSLYIRACYDLIGRCTMPRPQLVDNVKELHVRCGQYTKINSTSCLCSDSAQQLGIRLLERGRQEGPIAYTAAEVLHNHLVEHLSSIPSLNKKILGDVCYNLGVSHFYLEDYTQAACCLLRAHKYWGDDCDSICNALYQMTIDLSSADKKIDKRTDEIRSPVSDNEQSHPQK